MIAPVEQGRAPERALSASDDTDMRRLYLGVLVVEALTLLALWCFQQYFAL
ncbi:MAG: hypothetical protein ACRD2X_05505 [Vicinamibacteraceae bacterium]